MWPRWIQTTVKIREHSIRVKIGIIFCVTIKFHGWAWQIFGPPSIPFQTFWIITARKCPNYDIFFFCDLELRPLTMCMLIASVNRTHGNCMMLRWQKHCASVWRTCGWINRQTTESVNRDAWSQLKLTWILVWCLLYLAITQMLG